MKTTFDEIIDIVLDHEGGYVNDPDDAGGETKYGIAKRWYPDVDIKNLTKEQAKKIYHTDYWSRGKCDELPSQLRHIYFDMCVNFGRRGAVKVLQQAANSKTRNKISVDGGLGPMTIGALKGIELDRVRAFRVKYYVDLITARPEQEKFFLGWFRRATEV